MILVDTSVWIDHLRVGDAQLVELLEHGHVLVHPYVIGELALGNMVNRAAVLGAMGDLPSLSMATDREVLGFIESSVLHGSGIGYIDAHLLAAIRLTPGTQLWTRDKKLLSVANRLELTAGFVH